MGTCSSQALESYKPFSWECAAALYLRTWICGLAKSNSPGKNNVAGTGSPRQQGATVSLQDSCRIHPRLPSIPTLLGTHCWSNGWATLVTLVKGIGVGGDKKPLAERANSPCALAV